MSEYISRKELKSMSRCCDCGWRFPLKWVKALAEEDTDPDFSLREKMFQILACFQETNSLDDETDIHKCKVTFMGELL